MAVVSPSTDSELDLDLDSNLEQEQEESGAIKRPFDPEKIKVRTMNIVVDQIVSRIDHNEINLAPTFQRKVGIWKDQQKSRLIESLLLRIPIPVFYVAADKNETWSVVDGVQRTSTIYGYVKGNFSLTRLEYLTKLECHSYEQLPRPMQRRIHETQLIVNVIEPGTPEEVMFNIFRRINTGGLMLNGQEIRHALHPGPIGSFLQELTECEEFLEATSRSIKTDRMGDRECVLRFLAFHIDAWEGYSANDLDGYLGLAMKKVNAMHADERRDLSRDFRKAMSASYEMFGDHAFRKPFTEGERRKPINKALFEAWAVGLVRRSEDQIAALVESRKKVAKEFMAMMKNDWEFDKAITYSTGTPSRVRKRFQAIDELIQRCL